MPGTKALFYIDYDRVFFKGDHITGLMVVGCGTFTSCSARNSRNSVPASHIVVYAELPEKKPKKGMSI